MELTEKDRICREKKLSGAIRVNCEEETPCNKDKTFKSKHQTYRPEKKLEAMISISPTRTRKAELLGSLAKSPRTSKHQLKMTLWFQVKKPMIDNQVNKQIVNSLKNSFKILKSDSSGTMKESVRLAYSTGLKMAALGCKENRSIRKSVQLELRPSLILKFSEASPDPTS